MLSYMNPVLEQNRKLLNSLENDKKDIQEGLGGDLLKEYNNAVDAEISYIKDIKKLIEMCQ